MKLGAAYEVSGNIQKAIYHTKKAIEMDPYFIVAYVNLALYQKQVHIRGGFRGGGGGGTRPGPSYVEIF